MKQAALLIALASGAAGFKFTEVGCYADSADARDLDAFGVTESTAGMTVEKCARMATCLGYQYFGLQYGYQCYGGDSYGSYGRSTNCTMACDGDGDETCGGFDANSVYEASSADADAFNCNAPVMCASEPGASASWCDSSLDMDERVAALVANLSKEEKSGLFLNAALGVDRLNIPNYNWWSEALHGVARDGISTSFPQIIGVSSSFNTSLFHALGTLTGVEARGKNNPLDGQLYHGLTMWAPNVNIFRDPRWGRGQETPGEDPTLNGDYGREYVSGLQGDESSNGYLVTSACLKHYAAYSEEMGREHFAAVVTAQDMEDTYLPAFEEGVVNGKASSIMCSYNAETYGEGLYGPNTWAHQNNSIPSCANSVLLTDLARDSWGLDGYITSDCEAVADVAHGHSSTPGHNYTNTTAQTVNAVLSAGMDTDCGDYMSPEVMLDLMNSGDVAMDLIDTALSRLFKVQFRLGIFDPRDKVPFSSWGHEVVNTAAHQALAKEAADQSMVLLKNNDDTLPLDATNTGLTLAVLGRNANASDNMQGNYFGTAPFLVTPLEGLAAYASTLYSNGTDLEEAVALASKADVVVLVVGLTSEAVNPSDEAEGRDRTSLLLPYNQTDLIKAVAPVAKKLVLVSMNGGPLDLSQWRDDDAVGAILWCGYPGQSGGAAIADAIFGASQSSPTGKLTQTWYPQSFADKVGLKDMRMRPDDSSGYPGRTYRFYTGGDEVFRFGDGLTYTTFTQSLSLETPTLSAEVLRNHVASTSLLSKLRHEAALESTVHVSNSGSRDCDHIILIFAAAPAGVAGVDGVPLKTLVAYRRVHVRAGESAEVQVSLPVSALTFMDSKGGRQTAKGDWTLWAGNENEKTPSILTVI